MNRRLISFLLFFGITSSCFAGASVEKLVAAHYSDRYHVASCKIAKKIHPDDLVVYQTPEEAVAAGLTPCKKCNPPVPKDYKKSNNNFELKKMKELDVEE